ncbi:MAG TPA: hypothetical protein P5105_07000, partial [Victivallales bacterium]|nr:hypothetical protein [Victivallales bacterium]
DPERAREFRKKSIIDTKYSPNEDKFCAMCGPEFCSLRTSSEINNKFKAKTKTKKGVENEFKSE